MVNEITGNGYSYTVDTSYGNRKDGFIAEGTESIVYRGLKTKKEGNLQFYCVLKFKPKAFFESEQNRLELFKNEELKIFDKLRKCRSIVRIDDVIDDIGDFVLQHEGKYITSKDYFCVVEEFIDGCNLEQYCREHWQLRRNEDMPNGLKQQVDYHEFEEKDKTHVKNRYAKYDEVVKYQNQIMLFMRNLCEIMQFVTEDDETKILHLDIKPENIMVTKHGKELVLIDFGRAKQVGSNKFVQAALPSVNYNKSEADNNRFYQYGTVGYAAPECYAEENEGSNFPFSKKLNQGQMCVESDIFSFGATFWECFNIFGLVTNNEEFSKSSNGFYEKCFLHDDVYFNRDLSCTSKFYHKQAENIIKKCTRRREDSFEKAENNKYYHSYAEIRRDIEFAMDSIPTLERGERIKVKISFMACGVCTSILFLFLGLFIGYRATGFAVAQERWEAITQNYNDTQFIRLEEIANELTTVAPPNRVNDTYERIISFTYKDAGNISGVEARLLVSLLLESNATGLYSESVDVIMKNADPMAFRDICTEILRLENVNNSVGYTLAAAIYNVDIAKTQIAEAYDVLNEYKYNDEFRNAIIKLKNSLDTDEYIRIISEANNLTRPEVQDILRSIEGVG